MSYQLLPDESPEESVPSSILRQGARQLHNVATMAVGIPGDVFSLINEYVANPAIKAISGEEGVPYESTPLGKLIPTTAQHRKNLEPITGDYLKPTNEVERFGDEVVETLSSITNPKTLIKQGFKATKPVVNFLRSLGAQFLGETVKGLTGEETYGEAAKIGALILTHNIGSPKAAEQVADLYKIADSNLPANASHNASKLTNSLDSLEQFVSKGRPKGSLHTSEKFVLDQIDKVRALINNGAINIEQAIAQKRSLYKELDDLYTQLPDAKTRKSAKNFSKKIGTFLNETIDDYGRGNKAFWEPYKKADRAFGVLADSNFGTRWIQNNLTYNPVTKGLVDFVTPFATTTLKAVVPYTGVKIAYRIAKDPTLAKIYGNMMKQSVTGNSVAFNKSLKLLDEKLQEDESTDKYEFIDDDNAQEDQPPLPF